MAGKRKRTAAAAHEEEHKEDLELDGPPAVDPYVILDIDKSASADQVKSAYRRLALKHHPDKVTDKAKAQAHTKFQEIAAAYAILSDEGRRKRYDTTGRTDDSFGPGDDGDLDWTTFYREQYEDAVSMERIDEFAKQYKGSQEERKDLLATYTEYHGDMNDVYDHVMLSDPVEDETRFRAIIDAAITAGEVQSYKSYQNAKAGQKRVQKAKKRATQEAKEAEELAEQLGLKKRKKGMDDLAALIQKRQAGRSAFLDNLEAKYGGGKHDEPPEEAFAKNAATRLNTGF